MGQYSLASSKQKILGNATSSPLCFCFSCYFAFVDKSKVAICFNCYFAFVYKLNKDFLLLFCVCWYFAFDAIFHLLIFLHLLLFCVCWYFCICCYFAFVDTSKVASSVLLLLLVTTFSFFQLEKFLQLISHHCCPYLL